MKYLAFISLITSLRHLESRSPSLSALEVPISKTSIPSNFLMNPQEYVQGLHQISEDDRSDAAALLRQAREKHEKTILTSEGEVGKYLETVILDTSLRKDNTRRKDKSISEGSLIIFPYFSLAPYREQLSTKTKGRHIIKTLLQTMRSNVTKERELQQAVLKLEQTPKQHCFHVPQLWCLSINDSKSQPDLLSRDVENFKNPPKSRLHLSKENKVIWTWLLTIAAGLLITVAPLSSDGIKYQNITIKHLPSPKESKRPRMLHVSYGRNWRRLLEADKCRTWLVSFF